MAIVSVQILAKAIVEARDALVADDPAEAYHVLYTAAAAITADKYEPWKLIERLASEDA
jgi:hypothetical protein